jgi:hypothetical protein
MDMGSFAEINSARFGGQVGASCGCIGCFDTFDHIRGQWEIHRKFKKGEFHASDYNSLVCGCDGRFDGQLCNPGERGPGPEPRRAPANMACFSGVGRFSETGNKKEDPIAFRIEVEDRGEPGRDDKIRVRVWIPRFGESATSLADRVCCTIKERDLRVRLPDIDDGGTTNSDGTLSGGNLIGGNLQIHPVTPLTERGTCPPPRTTCPAFRP